MVRHAHDLEPGEDVLGAGGHVHHARTIAWFAETCVEGWATCSVPEAGFVRPSSNARVIPDARRPREAIDLLARIRLLSGHAFWPDDLSPTDADATAFARLVGHRQVTDAHLLTLRVRCGGMVATFDRGLLELAVGIGAVVELIP